MYLTRFVDIFREQGLAETRSLLIRGVSGVPDDEYALFESYCTDPNVLPRRQAARIDREREAGEPFETTQTQAS
jgi:hypothetical protein